MMCRILGSKKRMSKKRTTYMTTYDSSEWEKSEKRV